MYEARKAALEAYIKASALADVHRVIVEHAFNAGWEARKKAQYEHAHSIKRKNNETTMSAWEHDGDGWEPVSSLG